MTKTASKIAFVLMICTMFPSTAPAQTISLDDDPTFPLAGPMTAPFRSAEDPFGLGLPPIGMGLVGPSPTLVLGFADSDMLNVGPILDAGLGVLNYVDSVSENHAPIAMKSNPTLTMRFSVDRATAGIGALGVESGFWQASGDIYDSTAVFLHPGNFAGMPGPMPYAGVLGTAGVGGSNVLVFDESFFGLTAGAGVGIMTPPGAPTPMPIAGSHDNVDAYNDNPSATIAAVPIYYTLAPADAFLTGFAPSDIFVSVPPHGFGPMFAPSVAMGLDTMGGLDDIDALVLFDYGVPGAMDPGIDYALFSLSAGSGSLGPLFAANPMINPGAVFFTDFTGKFWTYAYSPDLGITNGIDFPCLNVDALEVW